MYAKNLLVAPKIDLITKNVLKVYQNMQNIANYVKCDKTCPKVEKPFAMY